MVLCYVINSSKQGKRDSVLRPYVVGKSGEAYVSSHTDMACHNRGVV